MIERLEAVLPKLGEPDTCAHSDDGLRDRFDEYPLDAWLCPRYLRGLADEALSELRASCTAKFGRRDTSAPEATYVRVDGTLDIEKATTCVLDGDDFDAAEENLAGCAARKRPTHDAPRERLVLLLLALLSAHLQHPVRRPHVPGS
ncbi:hypothetical protein [Streptomyces chartreusis]|uniref:hypothetical protein n=1 Tax=Streptomyces chartreusis TaxID=1969 RepID=UPI002E80FA31|nr:hypothetical protein [Streptomyces chartreusis]WUB21056.1 hypothetical protein OG997_31975 [Streptomyces chartreusis]